jgi:chemotaxis response regulator CheB
MPFSGALIDAGPAPAPEDDGLALPASAFHGFVVAIGASAGGLEALERLFAALPGDTGAAFVVIPEFDTKGRFRAISSPRRQCNQQVSAAAPVFL